MSTPSQTPPPKSSGSNLKYVLIGLLFLGAAISVLILGREEPTPAAPPPAPVEPPRANPLAEQDLVLEPEPEPEPTPEATPEPTKRKGPGFPKAGEWECSGDLAGATAVINENRTQIRSCYERRLKVNNVLQGDVKLRIRVGATGKVTATQTQGSLRDADVLACMRQLAQSWTFPAPSGDNCAVLSVPFRFAPKSP